MQKKIIVNLFPRNRYVSSANGRLVYPRERAKLNTLLGGADEVWVTTRMYARDSGVRMDYDVMHGSMGDEPPAEGIRLFQLTKSGQSPSLPYDGTSQMITLPDDGAFYFEPKMGLVDLAARLYNADGTIEFEAWATLIYR